MQKLLELISEISSGIKGPALAEIIDWSNFGMNHPQLL